MRTSAPLLAFVALLLAACAAQPAHEGRRFGQLLATYTEGEKRLDPFMAPYYGVEADLEKFGDYLSPEFFARRKALYDSTLKQLAAIDLAQLTAADQIEYRILQSDLATRRASLNFPSELLELNQMGSRLRSFIDESSPALSYFPFDTVAHYRAYLKRAQGFPAYVDRQIETLQRGVSTGKVLNCTIARKVLNTYAEGLEADPAKSVFNRPLTVMPAHIRGAQRAELTAGFQTTIAMHIVPAFAKFDAYFRNDYLPHCRESFGIGAFADGAAMYAQHIRENTDLDWTPEKIHAIGLAEVARITSEMLEAKNALGFQGSLTDLRRALRDDDRYYFSNGTDLFNAFKTYQTSVDAVMPKLFRQAPKTPFRIEANENPEDASARYYGPSDDKPVGRFIVNLANLRAVPRYTVGTLFLHEAIPGHHYQIAIQFEQKRISEYRRKIFFSTAFGEGWALYAERLGRENGLVSDPLLQIGSLNAEMLRAVRLVVDTGIHYFGWSRERAIRYMADNLTSGQDDIETEVDRYAVLPGQALGYKVGQLAILEQREKARQALGADFDLRDFHEVVIGHGMLPLSVLGAVVEQWIAARGGR